LAHSFSVDFSESDVGLPCDVALIAFTFVRGLRGENQKKKTKSWRDGRDFFLFSGVVSF
jgi:hypothetical protein